jgi:ribosomal protein S18 acetylase RimI-like enzyme
MPQAGGTTGPEKQTKLTPTVSVYSDKNGSHRFVKHDAGQPIAAIQVMSRAKGQGHVANVFTRPDHRRQGHGTELVRHAQRMFPQLTFSDDRSEIGQEFIKNLD